MKHIWNDFMKYHVERYQFLRAKGMVNYDALEFPIRWDRSITLHQHLFYIFKYYISELACFGYDDIEKVKKICTNILKVLECKNSPATMNSIKSIVELCGLMKSLYQIPRGTNLFRLRADKDNLKGKNDFMHVPFNKLYLCNSMRFSMPGEPCLYLGYSKDVCYKEMGIESGGSIGHFCTNEELDVIDLTLCCNNIILFELWPILAACYVAPDSRNANFKEEYVFPQVLMQYLKSVVDKDVVGLRYYSCREPNLNPMTNDYMNIALFANQESPDIKFDETYPHLPSYDKNLSDLLDFVQ